LRATSPANWFPKSRLINGLASLRGPAARRLQQGGSMKNLMENLLALQDLKFQTRRHSPEQKKLTQTLREKIPSQILGHYDRLMARGKKGLAAVRNQVCTGCHMRVPIGTITAIMHGTDIQLCGNCGRYLYLPEDEPVYSGRTAEDSKPAAPEPAKRKKRAPVYAG
jgi:predicted  nucleic acid-binding Zn-ribbon protein